MPNNVKALETIKNEQLNTLFIKLSDYQFKCFVPINHTKLKLFYEQFYARSIGTKGGRNSGLAFIFETQDGLLYGLTIKRHKAPNYSQWDYDCIVPIPNDFRYDDSSKIERTVELLSFLDVQEFNHGLSFVAENFNQGLSFTAQEPMKFYYSFDMIEEEYFVLDRSKEIYFVLKNTVVNQNYSARDHYVFSTSFIERFDVNEDVNDRHYNYSSIAYEYLEGNYATHLKVAIKTLIRTIPELR